MNYKQLLIIIQMVGGAICCGISMWAASQLIIKDDAEYAPLAITYLAMACVYLVSIILFGKL